MQKEKAVVVGVIATLLYCLISAISRVSVSEITQRVDPFVLCFYIFLIANVIYACLCVFTTKCIKTQIKENKWNLLMLNLWTLGAWLFLIYPLKYLEPSIISSVTLGLSPVITLLLGRFIYVKSNLKLTDVVISLFLLLAVSYLVLLCFIGYSSIGILRLKHLIVALFCSFIASISVALSNIYAKKLSNNGLKPLSILALRFIMLIIVSGGIALISAKQSTLHSLSSMIPSIILVSFIMVVIPLYFIQVGIKHLSPIFIAIIVPFMPITIFLLEFMDPREKPDKEVLVGILFMLGVTLIGTLIKSKQATEKRKSYEKSSSNC